MLRGQKIKIYTDHENLTRKALGANSDRVYRWRLLLEEFGPKIVYIKGIHNTVADAISRLDFTPKKIDGKTGKMLAMCQSAFMQALADKSDIDIHKMKKKDIIKWKAVSKCFVNLSAGSEDSRSNQNERTAGAYVERSEIGNAFFNRGKEDQEEIYPPTISEISDAQRNDKYLKEYFKQKGAKVSNSYKLSLVDNVQVLTENGKTVIPESLKRRIVAWYHEYLQHPGATRLEETLRATMTWNGL